MYKAWIEPLQTQLTDIKASLKSLLVSQRDPHCSPSPSPDDISEGTLCVCTFTCIMRSMNWCNRTKHCDNFIINSQVCDSMTTNFL